MAISVCETIHASPDKVWALITNIDGVADFMSEIKKIEVLERPSDGLLGLKWRETRVMFGTEAVETMTISAVEPGHWYETRAVNCGTEYRSRIEVADKGGGASELTFRFEGKPLTLLSRIFSPLMTYLFAGKLKACLARDLADIKRASESRARIGGAATRHVAKIPTSVIAIAANGNAAGSSAIAAVPRPCAAAPVARPRTTGSRMRSAVSTGAAIFAPSRPVM
eukprot:IDg16805t1